MGSNAGALVFILVAAIWAILLGLTYLTQLIAQLV